MQLVFPLGLKSEVLPANAEATSTQAVRLEIGFEESSHFEVGPTAQIWNNKQAPYHLYLVYPEPPYPPPPNTFEPSSEVVHSGSQSAKLCLLNPINDRARRIHIQHDWDPIKYKDLWVECWYYLPPNFAVDDWTDLHRGLEERWGHKDKPWTPGPYYNWFQITCTVSRWTKVSDTEYKIGSPINHGWVDNDGDGVNDLPAKYSVFSSDKIRLGEWFKITTYIYRDIEHGVYKLWLNDVLQWDLRDIRTIGILPERIASSPDNYQAWLASGIALYSGDLPNVHPKCAYYDDYKAWSSAYPEGLKGEYYSSSSAGQFTTKVMERIDSTVNFNWGSGSPGSGVPSDRFAVRWTGYLTVSTSGTYKIWVTADDGVRVWIDGNLVIKAWRLQPPTEYSWTGTLSAGKHSIKIEYYENTGGAVIKLGWTPPGGSKTYPIPFKNLSPL